VLVLPSYVDCHHLFDWAPALNVDAHPKGINWRAFEGVKLLDYTAGHAAIVASYIGETKRLCEAGVGYMAGDATEVSVRLRRLIAGPHGRVLLNNQAGALVANQDWRALTAGPIRS
jgi:hypothetical protein